MKPLESTGLAEPERSGFLRKFSIKTYQQARRIIRITIGLTLVFVGLLMVVLPGPASVVIPLGLGILASEFFWAKWLLGKFNRTLLSLIEINRKYQKKRKRAK